MAKAHPRALVLNADYTAIAMVDWTEAITLDCKGLVHVVDFYQGDKILVSNGDHIPVPAVIALKKYTSPKKKRIPFSRKNVFIRDRLICQYCGERFPPRMLTFDHVVPRSKWNMDKRGTPTCWENIVSCCYPCNSKKADKSLKEAGMTLKRQPVEPPCHGFVIGLKPWDKLEPEWLPYIPRHYKDMMEVKPTPS